MTSPTRLFIPPRTMLQTVWYDPGNNTWQAWTACHNRRAMFNDMLGTCLVMHPSGKAERMTVNPDGTVRMMEVIPDVSTTKRTKT